MPLIARQRSRLAVLAVLALVGSLLAVSAVPVAAKNGEADARATYSACVGAAAADAGFNDMAGSFAEDAANCLHHYGITKGTSERTFSPSASISRLQMALFLARAAGPAGITLPVASDQGFADIDGYTSEIQDAINQVAHLGIMAGRSDDMFSPSGLVTRSDMAVHLAAFLDKALVGPGGKDIDKVKPDDTVFTDIGSVAHSTYGAIRNLYEMGVTTGRTDTTFAPDGLVSRGQMALFITRALAHTNARPAGVSLQANKANAFEGDSIDFVASVRDNNHRPMANKSVDLFSLASNADPFNANGTCTSSAASVRGSNACEIDAGDPTTNSRGNTVAATLNVTAGTQVWAWTGDLGADFDNDTTDSASVTISVSAAAVSTRMTSSAATNTVRFGETVTFTFQLVDKDGNAVAKKGAPVMVSSRIMVDAQSGSDTMTSRTNTHTTDASGQIELSFTENDPDTASTSDDDATLTLTVTIPSGGYKLVDSNGKAASGHTTVMWDDDKAAATSLKLSSPLQYHVASNVGKGVSNTVQATVTDQYGDPVSGAKVDFSSNDTAGAPTESRNTGDNGVASLSYLRDSANNAKEMITASHGTVPSASIMHYWVHSSTGGVGSVLVADTANDTIVVEANNGDIVYAEYDSNDHLSTNGNRKVFASFEEDLGADLSMYALGLTWEIAVDSKGARSADAVSLFGLTSRLIGRDTVPPAVSTVQTSYSGDAIVLTYDEPLAASVPAVDDFGLTVTVNKNLPEETVRHTTISSVSVSGSAVTLAITPSVKVGDVIMVTYTGNALQDAAGNKAASLRSTVENRVDVIAPRISTAETSYDGADIVLTYIDDSGSLDGTSEPAVGAFTVVVDPPDKTNPAVVTPPAAVEVSTVNVSGLMVTLGLAKKLVEASVITVTYEQPTDPTANALQDIAGNKAVTVGPKTVINRTDTTSPKLVTQDAGLLQAPEMSADGKYVLLTYTDTPAVATLSQGSGLDDKSIPSPDSYRVTHPVNIRDANDNITGTEQKTFKPVSVDIFDISKTQQSAWVVKLELSDRVEVNAGTATVRYTKPTFGDSGLTDVVQDKAGNDADEFGTGTGTDDPVSVDLSTVDITAPTVSSAETSVDGVSIEIVYNEYLDTGFVLGKSGFTVTIGSRYTDERPSHVAVENFLDNGNERGKLTLTLEEPTRIANGETVQVTSVAAPVRDQVSLAAAKLTTAQAITNRVNDDRPVLVESGTLRPKADADGSIITLTFKENIDSSGGERVLDEESVPAADRFKVVINGERAYGIVVRVKNVASDTAAPTNLDRGTVELELPAALNLKNFNDPIVMVSYYDISSEDERTGVLQHGLGRVDVTTSEDVAVDTSAVTSN